MILAAVLALSSAVTLLPDFGGFVLQALPSNGLDRSLHAPVLVGLVFLTFFKETYGWTYAGIVVPGYLATVFIVAPVTGVLVCVESIVAYLLAALAGRWLPATGAWSSFFGRERFLLIIICAVLVRLSLEASLIPYLVETLELPHSRELYSIGLVLVPLVANSFWNAGIVSALPRVAAATGLTWAVVVGLLMPYTNFTVSRFQIANESVSLLFLETPHAYIILVLGSILAARDNVRYGWDYNGILVPALLGVALYQPTKLVTTVLEALVVLWLSQFLTQHGPLSRVLMVGSRRMLLAYSVGFIVKWLLGQVTLVVAPEVEMIDYFGFGYLLPTLLAVKMWNTDRIGATLMPTIQVAVTSFLLGNALAFGLRTVAPLRAATEWRSTPSPTRRSVALDLMLGDSAPNPSPVRAAWGRTTPSQQALGLLAELATAAGASVQLGTAWDPELAVSYRQTGWWTLVPRVTDPNADRLAPRMALRVPLADAGRWGVVIDADQVAAPAIVVGSAVADRIGARAILLRSRLPAVREHDDAFLAAALPILGVEHLLWLRAGGTAPTLDLAGTLPAGLEPASLAALLHREVALSWRAPGARSGPLDEALILRVPPVLLARVAAELWQAPPPTTWDGSLTTALDDRIVELTTVEPGAFRRPTHEELRLFGKGLLPLILEGRPPSSWARALAHELGMSIARVGDDLAWVLYEPAGADRRGMATFAVRGAGNRADDRSGQLMIEVSAPRWEAGVLDAAWALTRALHAEGVLVAGAMPTAGPDRSADVRHANGAQSLFQLVHEAWVQAGHETAFVYGIAPDRQVRGDVVITFDQPLASPEEGPPWSRRIVAPLVAAGLAVRAVDRSLELEPFAAATNPAMAYSRHFAPGHSVAIWLTESTRSRLLAGIDDRIAGERLERLGVSVARGSVSARAVELARCLPRGAPPGPDCPQLPSDCHHALPVSDLLAHARTNNPYALRAAFDPAYGCHLEALRDARSERLWVLVAGGDRVELVPVRVGNLAGATRTLHSRAEIELAMAFGLRAIRVGGGR